MTLPAEVAIRRAISDDAEALSELHLDCWDDAYADLVSPEILAERRMRVQERTDFWRETLEQGVAIWLAGRRDQLIGFAGARPGIDEDLTGLLELRVLYVRAAWWGTPVGHELFVRAVGDAGSYLCVLEGNARAIRFYERQGYCRDGFVEDVPEGRHLRMVRRAGPDGMPDGRLRLPPT
jgi:GNAT superfamily N-acetyltransferase